MFKKKKKKEEKLSLIFNCKSLQLVEKETQKSWLFLRSKYWSCFVKKGKCRENKFTTAISSSTASWKGANGT